MLGAKFDSTKTALRDLLADPKLTFHLKESAQADLPADARAVTDPEEKCRVFLNAPKLAEYVNEANVQEWVDGSPLIEVVC